MAEVNETPKRPRMSIKRELCKFSIAYEAIAQMADEQCNEECVRVKMFDGLKKAEKIMETELLRMLDSPRGRIKADMKTFDTRHLITCRAGFHLVKSHYKRCFPCLPGHYSEANSVQCSPCDIGYYQEKYGKHECNKCTTGRTTEIMGAKSKDECVSVNSK
ncbi:ephrin_rec_like domain-containing protein [Nephila pilipes]|uniref:Ephrin_rec_like domain-containing protein n=1 Tax=Nephila pilipes TaxID=299642 RepID=A0A8X6U6T6_NEPPI|nr:ephrin_rec_like domain-containing protein [Nephila pilipes]